MVKDINSVYGATLVAMLFAKKESAPPIEPVSEDKTVEGEIERTKIEPIQPDDIPMSDDVDFLVGKINQLIHTVNNLSSNAKTK